MSTMMIMIMINIIIIIIIIIIIPQASGQPRARGGSRAGGMRSTTKTSDTGDCFSCAQHAARPDKERSGILDDEHIGDTRSSRRTRSTPQL